MTASDTPMPCGGDLPDVAYAAALAGLRSMTPQRLQRVLRGRLAAEIFADLRTPRARLVSRLMRAEQTPGHGGVRAAQIVDAWRRAAAAADPALLWAQLVDSGIAVFRRGDPGYPGRLVDDRAAPELVFVRGTISQLERPCVALVGTRSATYYGSNVASELGADLSEAGVVVVSGLAAGIDSAAHEGALACNSPTPPVAVVGGGVDVVYPASGRRLWSRLEQAGGILSEAAPGAAPEGWRFPLRNRLIAALAHVVVVVESHAGGGALHTVGAADERGVTVLAVPGSVRSPASEGTNSLIADGCGVARDAQDVLVALELACAGTGRALRTGAAAAGAAAAAGGRATSGERAAAAGAAAATGGSATSAAQDSPAQAPAAVLSPAERSVLDALEEVSIPFELVSERSGLPLAGAAVALERLACLGLAARSGSGWERRGARRP